MQVCLTFYKSYKNIPLTIFYLKPEPQSSQDALCHILQCYHTFFQEVKSLNRRWTTFFWTYGATQTHFTLWWRGKHTTLTYLVPLIYPLGNISPNICKTPPIYLVVKDQPTIFHSISTIFYILSIFLTSNILEEWHVPQIAVDIVNVN